MQKRVPVYSVLETLPEPAASGLLARAAELDAARAHGVTVADLRAAASEAGISASSFDAALAELQGTEEARPPNPARKSQRRGRLWAIAVAVVAALTVGAIAVQRGVVQRVERGPGGVPIVEEAILLRCLDPVEAADLMRPLLTLPSNGMTAHNGSRVLTVRATKDQLRQVHALLDTHEAGCSIPQGTKPR